MMGMGAGSVRLSSMIEKRLFVVWVGGHDPPEACITSWRDLHPTWEFQVISQHRGWANQHVIDEVLRVEAARGADPWAAVADVIRWELLSSARSGIVVSADSRCLRALDHQNSSDELQVDFFSHEAWAVGGFESGSFLTCAMGAAPRAVVFARCVEEVSKLDVSAVPAGQLHDALGAGLLTRVSRELPPGTISALPTKLFAPEHWSGRKAGDVVVPGGGVRTPTYAEQYYGYRNGYGRLRRWACQCQPCRVANYMPWH